MRIFVLKLEDPSNIIAVVVQRVLSRGNNINLGLLLNAPGFLELVVFFSFAIIRIVDVGTRLFG